MIRWSFGNLYDMSYYYYYYFTREEIKIVFLYIHHCVIMSVIYYSFNAQDH